jgi:type IV secretion system protein VirB6
MACPEVYSGVAFLSSTLAYVDCQAQSIGAFGFQALSAPNSIGAAVLEGLLTLFVALFGYRLLLGFPVDGRDVITGVLKIGVVLTLATSWIAYRTLAYDTVLYGPAEVAGAITGLSELSSRYALADRLENVDSGILALTAAGTGRSQVDEDKTSGPGAARSDPNQPGGAPAAFGTIAVNDAFAMGASRVAYLAGALAPLIALRLAAGVLTALAPLIAGVLLFEGVQGVFFGWVRALAAVALGSLAMIVSLSVELTLLEPWLSDVMARRAARVLTPAAPTELVVMTTSFAVAEFALMLLFARLAFNAGPVTRVLRDAREPVGPGRDRTVPASARPVSEPSPPRAAQVAERLTSLYRGERRLTRDEAADGVWQAASAGGGRPSPDRGSEPSASFAQVPLGTSYRRSTRRSSRAASTRDRRT